MDPLNHLLYRKMKKPIYTYILILGGVFLVGAFSANAKGLWKQATHLQKQRELCQILFTPDTIIYTEDPGRFQDVIPGQPYTSYAQYREGMPDAKERKLDSYMFEGRFFSSSKVVNLVGAYSYGQKMSSPSGDKWIVKLGSVQVFPYKKDEGNSSMRAPPPGEGYRTAIIGQSAIRPVGWRIGSRGTSISISGNKMLLGPDDQLTVWAPQQDPDDSSRVTVMYEINDEKGMLEGSLDYDGRIYFSVLSGPAKMLMVKRLFKTEIHDVNGKFLYGSD